MLSPRLLFKTASQTRQMSIMISGPPGNHITLMEKACHGLFIAFSCLATPAWVLTHIFEYRSRTKD